MKLFLDLLELIESMNTTAHIDWNPPKAMPRGYEVYFGFLKMDGNDLRLAFSISKEPVRGEHGSYRVGQIYFLSYNEEVEHYVDMSPTNKNEFGLKITSAIINGYAEKLKDIEFDAIWFSGAKVNHQGRASFQDIAKRLAPKLNCEFEAINNQRAFMFKAGFTHDQKQDMIRLTDQQFEKHKSPSAV